LRGTNQNIVPDGCQSRLTADVAGETETSVRREITAAAESKNCPPTISSAKLAPALPLETNCKLPLVREFLRSVGQKKPTGRGLFFVTRRWLSRAGFQWCSGGRHRTGTHGGRMDSLSELERGKNLLRKF